MLGLSAALAALLTAYVRAEGKALGAPQQYCGPMAKPQRMLVVASLSLFCGLVPSQWQPSFRIVGVEFGIVGAGLVAIAAGGVWTGWRRLQRIACQVATRYPTRA